MIVLRHNKRMHFVGIGGIGMCAIAEMLHHLGFVVSGSDREPSAITRRLENLGIRIQQGHEPNLIEGSDVVVYSSAVRSDNPELMYAQQHGIPTVKRAEVQGEIMRTRFSIGVSGTHGKTTTSTLMGAVIRDAGLDPMVLVGGIPRDRDTNAAVGRGEILVAEADEYDRSFLKMYPAVAVITNIEAEHLDCYSGIGEIEDAFVQYANAVPFFGAVVACSDHPGVKSVMHRITRTLITYGCDSGADYRARIIECGATSSRFDVYRRTEFVGSAVLGIPGRHNVTNAMAVAAVALELGIEFATIARSFQLFRGVKRRFEIVGESKGVTVVDDYAHHPSEVRATLATARSASFKRVIAVFQPHLYTRTRDFLDDFAAALQDSDILIITEIYRSREEPIPSVRAELLVQRAKEKGHAQVHFVPQLEQIVEILAQLTREGDGIILMGAGSITSIGGIVLQRIANG